MKLERHITDGLRPIVDLLYPPRCPLCGDALSDQTGVCGDCWMQFEFPADPSCESCGLPLRGEHQLLDHRCNICTEHPPRHSGIAAATIYNDVSRKLVLQFKHGGRIALSKIMGRVMGNRLEKPTSDRATILVPVPLHWTRLWKRGYNQSALLCEELERLGHGNSIPDALKRLKITQSLGGLDKRQRRTLLSGAISANSRHTEALRGADILLVDDVLTSGATSEACVDALLDAGAKSVRIACFARVVQ